MLCRPECPGCSECVGYISKDVNMSNKKTTGSVYEIRTGVYAYGTMGRKALAVVARPKKGAPYAGVRGRKPTIDAGATPITPPKEAQAAIARLLGTAQ